MPISEDEFEHHTSEATSTSAMSKAELRKTHKPIMEKRRRARINHSLNEIKSLILNALNKDPARHSKLEKADILEMAVKHLQNIQRQQLARAIAMDPNVLQKFKAGFNECSDEVGNYISQLEGVDNNLKQRIKSHLQGCISGIEQMAQFNNIAGLLNPNAFLPPNHSQEPALDDQNNNPRIQIPQGLQLIPSRLPTGEFAFLVPNSNNLQFPFPSLSSAVNESKPQRSSAFVTVIPSSEGKATRILSPPLSPETNHAEELFSGTRSPSPHGFRPVNPSIQKSLRSAFISTALKKPEAPPHRSSAEFSTALTNLANARSQAQEIKPTIDPLPIIIQDNRTPENPIRQDEVKTIKFPIHTNRKIEPLCIITNHSERYKQAQILEETANYEENIQRGVKRKFNEMAQPGLLTIANNLEMKPKIFKINKEPLPSTSKEQTSSIFNAISSKVIVKNPQTSHEIPKEHIVDLTKVDLMDETHRLEVVAHAPTRKIPVEIRDVQEPIEGGSDMWRPW